MKENQLSETSLAMDHLGFCSSQGTRSTIERGRGCNKLVSVLRGNGTKIAPTGDICVQPPGEMSWIRGKLADHVGDHAVLSPEEVVLVTSSGTELSHPRLSQSLNNSRVLLCRAVHMFDYDR